MTNITDGVVAALPYTRQHQPLGLGHAVWCARRLIGEEPFAVILPDDVIAADKPCLAQMIDAFNENPGNIVAAMEVPDDKASAYGVLDIKEDMGDLVSTKGMVEKPAPGTAPSNLAVIGRYILTPTVLAMRYTVNMRALGLNIRRCAAVGHKTASVVLLSQFRIVKNTDTAAARSENQ